MRRGEECLVIYGLVASFKEEKRKVNMGDAWFRVSPLSLSLSLIWSSGLQIVVYHLLISPHWSYAQKPSFSILKKVSAPITSGECSSCRLVASSLTCISFFKKLSVFNTGGKVNKEVIFTILLFCYQCK